MNTSKLNKIIKTMEKGREKAEENSGWLENCEKK